MKNQKVILLCGAALSTFGIAAGVSHADTIHTDTINRTIQVKELDTNKILNQVKLKESKGVKLSKNNLKAAVPVGYHLDKVSNMNSNKITLYAEADSNETAEMPLEFVDEGGKTVGIGTVRGDIGTQIDISSSVPTNYKLVNDKDGLVTIKADQTSPVKLTVTKVNDSNDDSNQNMVNDQKIEFVDDQGKVISTGTVSGTKGSTVDISNILPNGYALDNDNDKNVVIDGQTKKIKVAKTATMRVRFVDKDGNICSKTSVYYITGKVGSKVDVSSCVLVDYEITNPDDRFVTIDPSREGEIIKILVNKKDDSAKSSSSSSKSSSSSSESSSSSSKSSSSSSKSSSSSSKSSSSSSKSSSSSSKSSSSSSKSSSNVNSSSKDETPDFGFGSGTTATTGSDKFSDKSSSSSNKSSTISSSNSVNSSSNDNSSNNDAKNDYGLNNGTTATTGSDKLASDVSSTGSSTANSDASSNAGNELGLGNGTTATTGSDKLASNASSTGSSTANSDTSSNAGNDLGLGNGTTATTGLDSDTNNKDGKANDVKTTQPGGTTATTGLDKDSKGQNTGNGFAATGGTDKVSHSKLYDLIYINIPHFFKQGIQTIVDWFK